MPREISDKSRLKQKRGKVDLKKPENYIPWIKVRDLFRGEGTRHAIVDIYHKSRLIHLMSNIERDVYFTLRSNENVLELFEQFPLLPRRKTEELCNKYLLRHPRDPRTMKNIVMTTDFLLLIKDKEGKKKWQACAVKPSKDLSDKRTREKLFIEKMYWESIGVQWGIMTELQINKYYVNNVILCKSGYTGTGNGTYYDLLKYLIVQKEIDVDMKIPINLDNLLSKIHKGEITIGRTGLLNEK